MTTSVFSFEMDFRLIVPVALLQVFVLLNCHTYGQLLTACVKDADCGVTHSFCDSGLCICQPFYAQYKSKCLPSRLLDQECITDEQCSMKVAQSTCSGGKCTCSDGYLKFRHHTCLTAAKPGDVCFNNDHCRLWTRNSHCQFMIPNLVGRCSCNAQTRLHDTLCLTEEEAAILNKERTTEGFTEGSLPSTTFLSPAEPETEDVNEYVSKVKVSEEEDPFYDQKHHNTAATTSDQQLELASNHSGGLYRETAVDFPSSIPNGTTEHFRYWSQKEVVSLGLPCLSDDQCRRADNGSRCIENVCQCTVPTKPVCQGCPADTFQCHSSGACLSWFFVCDGRPDCSDGSDEDCGGPVCPQQSFQCGREGICVSRSVICDGTVNCPNGEDELLCNSSHCPYHSFQCGNGQCVPEHEFCNAIPSCEDGSDEMEEMCGSNMADGRGTKSIESDEVDECPFRCQNGRCRSTAILCSSRDGCGDNSDEKICTVCRCPTQT